MQFIVNFFLYDGFFALFVMTTDPEKLRRPKPIAIFMVTIFAAISFIFGIRLAGFGEKVVSEMKPFKSQNFREFGQFILYYLYWELQCM